MGSRPSRRAPWKWLFPFCSEAPPMRDERVDAIVERVDEVEARLKILDDRVKTIVREGIKA